LDRSFNGVTTVTTSKPSSNESGPHLAWRGTDPVQFSAVQAALQEANIPTYEIDEHDQLAFQHVAGPFYGIFVRHEDVARAQKIANEALGEKPEK
jgi:hypothetical protein